MPSIIVLPMLKNVDEKIVGTIKRIAKGLNIPPVKNKRKLNCIISYIKKELEYNNEQIILPPNHYSKGYIERIIDDIKWDDYPFFPEPEKN